MLVGPLRLTVAAGVILLDYHHGRRISSVFIDARKLFIVEGICYT